jgi:hypothetical protein
VRSDWIISGVGHAAILAFGLVSLASSKPTDVLSDFMPVTIVTDADISRATAGQKNAPKAEEPKPLVDKVGDPKPVKQLAPKAADKPEVTTDSAPLPQPKPEAKAEATPKPKTPDIKPDKVAQQPKKDEGKKAKPEKKQPQFNPDLIAQELKRDEAKTPPTPREQRPSPKFDADQVAALLDKREPQRQLAFGDTLNNAAALGTANGHAAQLSQSELDALRARLSQCWSPPPGIESSSRVYVVLRVQFRPDGSVAREPDVVEDSGSALGSALTESAKRALRLCQPFTMLKPEHYDLWKDIEVKFDPQELLGG